MGVAASVGMPDAVCVDVSTMTLSKVRPISPSSSIAVARAGQPSSAAKLHRRSRPLLLDWRCVSASEPRIAQIDMAKPVRYSKWTGSAA
jgi:hypothetical protein